jgi:hypothetical protein
MAVVAGACLAGSSPVAALAAPGYDVIVVAGQSNSTCAGMGPFDDPLATPAIRSRIFQIGRLRASDMQLVPAEGNLVSDTAANDRGTVRRFECLQDWNYYPGLAGTGFALAFAEKYVVTVLAPDRAVLIVPCGCGSTSIRSWAGTLERPDIPCTRGNAGATESVLYADMVKRTRRALAEPGSNRIVAFLWHQGESDALAPLGYRLTPDEYRGTLADFFRKARQDLAGSAPLPIVTAHFSPAWVPLLSPANLGLKRQVEAAVDAACAAVGHCAVVPTDGLTDNLTSGASTDRRQIIHFDARSMIRLGQTMFDRWQGLASGMPPG